MTSIYDAHPNYLQSRRWRTIRWWRLWLNDYRCQTCYATERLQAHHRSYKWFNRWGAIGIVFELMDTITLCDKCHGGVHKAQHIEEFRD